MFLLSNLFVVEYDFVFSLELEVQSLIIISRIESYICCNRNFSPSLSFAVEYRYSSNFGPYRFKT